MKIYPYNGIIYLANQNYGYEERYDKTIIVDDGNIDLDAFNINPDTEIIPKDKIFVSKHSSFPSLFLSRIEGIDVSRTVSMDKATRIVIDSVGQVRKYLTNCWYCEFISSNPDKPMLRTVVTNQQWCNVQYIGGINRFKHLDLTTYTTKLVTACMVVDIPFELAGILIHYPDKIVLTEKLTDYTNSFLPKLDNDLLESLSNMLSGGDKESVKLGINLLSNYDLTSHIIPIAGMIRTNFQKIVEARCASLSAFNRICDVCGIENSDLKYTNVLDFNAKLYNAVSSDNDRQLLHDIVAKYIRDEVTSQYNRYMTQMGIKVCID